MASKLEFSTKRSKNLISWLSWLLMALPSTLFFSYQPLIQLGETASMHLELSLPLIWLALISLLSLPLLPQIFKATPKKLLFALAIIPLYTLLSLSWSANPLRTFLSFGVLTCLALTILIAPVIYRLTPNFQLKTLRLFLFTAITVSLFAWLQTVLDVAGLSPSLTLLCEGCTYQAFGFSHPNAFAIEPQFFGNLLIAPVFLCCYSLLYNKNRLMSNKLLLFTTFLLTATLFFTFSRGAIYSFLISIAILILYQLIKKQPKYLKLIPIILCSAIVSLFCQGLFAQISPTNDTFLSGITKSIHHLTLGTIDFRPRESSVSTRESSVPTTGSSQQEDQSAWRDSPTGEEGDTTEGTLTHGDDEVIEYGGDTSRDRTPAPERIGSSGLAPATAGGQPGAREGIFANSQQQPQPSSKYDGYVEESTSVRLGLTDSALALWSSSPQTIILGTGLGGAGPLLYQNYPELGTAQQIVQNEYASLLLEFGLLGLAVIIAAVSLIITSVRISSTPQRRWFYTLLLAYAFSLFFFSGLPNALHIYLLPAFFLCFSKHQSLIH